MLREIKAIKTLLPLIKLYPWAIPTIIILGIISSLAEGLGISLMIPFLHSLYPNDNQASFGISFLKIYAQLFSAISFSIRPFIITSCILIFIICKSVLSYIYTALCYWLQYHILHLLRSRIFQQLMTVSQSFWDANKCGELLNTLSRETDLAASAFTYLIWGTINSCMILVFTVLLLFISWKLTLLVTGAFVLISSIVYRLAGQVKKLGKHNLLANINLNNLMVEGLTGIKTIQAFSREAYEQKQFECASKQVRDLYVKLRMLSAMVDPISEGLAVALLVCIMLIALHNQVTLPILVTFIFMLYRLQPQVKQFDNNRLQVVALTSSVKDVMSLLESSEQPYIRSGKISFPGLEQAISFASVTFCYNLQEKPAIENISVSIPKGKTTAIVGHSGSGKSTLINLIFRFYDVTEGEIYVDGYLLRELDLASWRSHIAMVSQDVHIFSTTVRENIAYGRLNVNEEEILAAAKQAHAHEFICNLPQGYDTQVGDRGIRLSGGQRQRISIARAILCNPEILILDEATNALDSISEQLIQEAINTLSQNRTVIVIAHRLSTIEKADRIIVLEKGRVIEQGFFQELLKNNGLFSQLYQLQYGGV